MTTKFEDVSAAELEEEIVREQEAITAEFMSQFVDHEPDALPIGVQIRRVLRQNMKSQASDNQA